MTLKSGTEHRHVGPMTGVCSPSMAVWVTEDPASDRRACSTLNEGPGDTLWFGVGGDEAIERLRFFRDHLGPSLSRLLAAEGPIDVFSLAAQGVNMGDELHMRSQATGNLLLRDLAGGLAAAGDERSARFIAGNHHFFLTLTMGAAKVCAMAAEGVSGSTVVTAIARNGTDVGVQVAGLPGSLVRLGGGPRRGRAAARRLRGGGCRPRHRRLGDHRVRRAGRDGARGLAGGGGVLRR